MAREDWQLTSSMPPGIRLGELPPFHKLDEYTFQDLCRDLFDAEPGIAACDVYGVRGQSQGGIDLLAHQAEGTRIEVGQCKCHKSFSSSEICKASDEFLKHWDSRWSKENVGRFILFVACDLSRTKQQDEILKQRKRFADLDIKYEAWSAAKIQNKLRSHPDIVARYLGPSDHWLRTICGVAAISPPTSDDTQERIRVVVSAALANQLEQLYARLSEEIEQRLESMRTACREGKRVEAITWLRDLKRDNTLWSTLPASTKAKLLSFEAGLELDVTGDIRRARQLADEAQGLAPSENQARLRAHIAWREEGPEAAINLLEGQDDIDSLNLKAILLLEMGRINESLAILTFKDIGRRANGEPQTKY
jgi:hypothetical protein